MKETKSKPKVSFHIFGPTEMKKIELLNVISTLLLVRHIVPDGGIFKVEEILLSYIFQTSDFRSLGTGGNSKESQNVVPC